MRAPVQTAASRAALVVQKVAHLTGLRNHQHRVVCPRRTLTYAVNATVTMRQSAAGSPHDLRRPTIHAMDTVK
jgi:hypothetical protein